MLPDYHIHTHLCNHAEGPMRAYVEAAVERGLTEMGFSEHMPFMPESHLCMRFGDMEEYAGTVHALRGEFRDRITIKYGAEVDIVLERRDEIARFIDDQAFDYVIGSVHYLDSWPFDQGQYRHRFEEEDLMAVYERFFKAVERGMETGLYDIVGHIDLIKRMGYVPEGDLTSLYEHAARRAAELGLAVELNTSGYDRPCAEPYPSAAFLGILNAHGVPVTVGSDAHKPDEVARHYPEALELLRNAGYDAVAGFSRRERTAMSLPAPGHG